MGIIPLSELLLNLSSQLRCHFQWSLVPELEIQRKEEIFFPFFKLSFLTYGSWDCSVHLQALVYSV
uniref:Uncharacterized protein n=1 Tax=Brassica oleracea TaxID=3712 RepID=A0A3P6E2K5_BRAOL|nr:unnamed protein product [Brassica oleracea]